MFTANTIISQNDCNTLNIAHFKCILPTSKAKLTLFHIVSVCLSFFQVLQSCLLHIIHKGRYIASNYNSAFFRADHNASEIEAYCSALCQLRALLYLAQQLINDNDYGELYSLQDGDLSRKFVQEYSSMHKACFYGRCLGFQVSQTQGLISHVIQITYDVQASLFVYLILVKYLLFPLTVLTNSASVPPDCCNKHGIIWRDVW